MLRYDNYSNLLGEGGSLGPPLIHYNVFIEHNYKKVKPNARITTTKGRKIKLNLI